MNTLNVASAVLSGVGAFAAAAAFAKIFGSKRDRDVLIMNARAAERAKLATRRLQTARGKRARSAPGDMVDRDELIVHAGR